MTIHLDKEEQKQTHKNTQTLEEQGDGDEPQRASQTGSPQENSSESESEQLSEDDAENLQKMLLRGARKAKVKQVSLPSGKDIFLQIWADADGKEALEKMLKAEIGPAALLFEGIEEHCMMKLKHPDEKVSAQEEPHA